jgi:hypothetical protein
MVSLAHRWFSNPVVLLLLCACLGAFVVQAGEVGSADTMHRLQTAHSFWTPEPPVFPQEYPEFGVHGRGGKLYDWYGIGQPLLLLPADIVATFVERLHCFAEYNGNDPSVRSIVVSNLINMLLNVLTALVCLKFLRLLNFTQSQAIAGALALLFCTTHLHYTQNMMENNYILLLTLTGFTYQYEWFRAGSKRALIAGAGAFGLNLLTRLTTGIDLIAGGVFLLLVLFFEKASYREWRARLVHYVEVSAPVYAIFLLIDRLYQYYRFGSFFNTYVSVVAREYHKLDPSLPANYPWETPFHVGFLGPLIKPEKSIFLFDPLLVLTILIATLAWKRLTAEIKAYVIGSLVLVLGYISFYARYTVWSGDFAWGDRYASTAVELAAFISVPLLMRYRQGLGNLVWKLGIALIAISAVIQVASLAFWVPLEIYQMETLGHPTFVIWLRFKNIVAFALGRMNAWGLSNQAMTEDPWDYVRITTWNFLPFVLKRVGAAPTWVIQITLAGWTASVVALGGLLLKLARVMRECVDPA